MNDKGQMENILKEFACSSCLFISKVAKLRCGDNLCEMHVFSNKKIIPICIICNEQIDQSFLQAFIRNNNYIHQNNNFKNNKQIFRFNFKINDKQSLKNKKLVDFTNLYD